jgi:Flp pilus assembly protein TadG
MIMTPKRGERGQSLAELGIVITMFVFLTMGVIELGRAFMILNMITQAARDGARAAAAASSIRDSQGIITNTTAIVDRVRAQIQNVTDASPFTVTVSQPPCGATNNVRVVQVTVSGPLNYLFNMLPGGSITVNRVAAFRDEVLTCP